MHKKFLLGMIVMGLVMGMTGCSMSNLVGKEEIAMKEVPTVQTTERPVEVRPNQTTQATEGETIPTTQPQTQQITTQPQIQPTITPQEEQTTSAPVKPNKQGNINYKYFVFTSGTDLPNGNQVINTAEQWQAFSSVLGQYKGNDTGFNGSSMLNDYFYVVIPVRNSKSSWSYNIDSVKNNDNLTIAMLCEKKNDANATDQNAIVIVAISRKDMPTAPTVDKVVIKNSSYTIK